MPLLKNVQNNCGTRMLPLMKAVVVIHVQSIDV